MLISLTLFSPPLPLRVRPVMVVVRCVIVRVCVEWGREMRGGGCVWWVGGKEEEQRRRRGGAKQL